jgi:hypothetical protein
MTDITNIKAVSINVTYEEDRRKGRDWFGNEGYCYYNGRYRLVIEHTNTVLDINELYIYKDRCYMVKSIQRDYNVLTCSYELISFTPVIYD